MQKSEESGAESSLVLSFKKARPRGEREIAILVESRQGATSVAARQTPLGNVINLRNVASNEEHFQYLSRAYQSDFERQNTWFEIDFIPKFL